MAGNIGRGERPQVNTRAVVLIMAGIVMTLVLIAFGFRVLFPNRVGISGVSSHVLPAPGVSSDERQERMALEAKQRLELDGAGGRLPIDAAMKAIAAKGTHAFDPIEPGP